jgi:hypothetical protein
MIEVIRCPQCQKQLRLPEGYVGKRVKCPACPTTFTATPSELEEPALPLREEWLDGVRQAAAPVEEEARDEEPPRRRKRRPSRRRRRYDYEDDDDEDSPYRKVWPHRGGLVMTLGICSLVLALVPCFTVFGLKLGIISLILAIVDLRSMSRGEMDREGRGMTQGGLVCSIIALALSVLMLPVFILLMIAAEHAH